MNVNEIAQLKRAADKASDEFDRACRPYWCDGRWGFYRAAECGQNVPKEVTEAGDLYLAALHAFYRARDGERGFLGSVACG